MGNNIFRLGGRYNVRRERFRALKERAWQYFQSGELDTSHQAMLMEVIQVGLSEQTEGTE
ncbi:MAG: hypothetical protein IH881_18095 [Myxococcales bacterium]|nr:hypothetical protein [Myxococcales bacterium]